MTIPSSALPRTVNNLVQLQIVDPATGIPTEYFLTLMKSLIEQHQAANRVIPCSASGTNVITLTPNSAAPLIERYVDYEIFPFVAANTSTGSVTATVVPATGTLATLKVYIDGGDTQAGSGDVVSGRLYLACFADHLDTGAGGFVLFS